jgi:hypothetical protein
MRVSKNFSKLSPNDAGIDHSYQRALDEPRVNAMSKNFDETRVGVPVLSMRKDGTYVVLDGQHRFESMRRAGLHEMKILCEVHNGLSPREEAELFLKLNGGRKSPRVFDKYRARIKACEPFAVEFTRIVESVGLRIGQAPGKHTVCAIQSVESVHRRSGNLKETLAVLKEWGKGDAAALDGDLIKDMSAFLDDYEGQINASELIDRLTRKDPGHVLRQIKATADALDRNRRLASTSVLREIYNHRRVKGSKLSVPGASE